MNNPVNSSINSLGFEKQPKDTRVVVAMSGGVDSSVVAAMLKEEGYDVIGITLQLYDHGAATVCDTSAGPVARSAEASRQTSAGPVKTNSKTCCAGADIHDARKVAAAIGIPHYVLDYESAFRQSVMDDFADSYLRGETPIPCVRCNQHVKFRDLLRAAKDLGADCLATGHYVQRVTGPHGAELHRAADSSRDQSYFLFATTQEQLDYLRFPLGGLSSKAETRALAARYGLAVAEKPDSQDICFVPQGRYADVVAKLRPGAIEPGEIVDENGAVLGRHEGIIHFTIGQRKGLNLTEREGSARDPYFVTGLNAAKKQVIVGTRHKLAIMALDLKDMNWLAGAGGSRRVMIKFRSSMEPVEAALSLTGDGRARILFDAPQFGVAPGQACVAYDGARVLGGGWIAATHNQDAAARFLPEQATGLYATA